MTRSVITRMVALLVVIGVGGWFVFIEVLQYRIGAQTFPVTLMATDAGGIYQGASVTYRGVPVGRVSSLGLSTSGVQIHVALDPGTHVPANAGASVRELSALGEQYLDLTPTSASGPDLHSGSVIPASRVTVPTPVGTALLDLGGLLNSVNPGDFQTVESFLTTAFSGTGPALRTIVVTGQQLFNALVAAQADNISLITDGQPVLQSLQQTDDQFATFTQGLASVTGQLARSNSDLQALIANGSAAEAALNPFLGTNNAAIESTIASLGASSLEAQTYAPQVQAMFQILPVVAGQLAGSASGGLVRGELKFNTANTVCPYIAPSAIPLPTQPVATPTLTNGCTASAPDLIQRGFKN